MQKKQYEKPEMNIMVFTKEDILASSPLDKDPNQGEWDELSLLFQIN